MDTARDKNIAAETTSSISTDAPPQAATSDVKLPAPIGKKTTKERKYPAEKLTGENEPASDLLSIETTTSSAPNEPSSAGGKDRNLKKAEAYVNPERVRTGGAQRVS
jgi:hypothetical protein